MTKDVKHTMRERQRFRKPGDIREERKQSQRGVSTSSDQKTIIRRGLHAQNPN